MTALAKTYTFVAGTPIESGEANQNFDDIVGYVNAEVVVRDGSKAFTSIPTGPATNPTTDNQFTRKKYVDDQDTAITTTVTSNKTAADNAFLKRPQFTDDNRIIRAADWTGTTDSSGKITAVFRNAAGTNVPFPNSVITVVACSGDTAAAGIVIGIESKSTTGFVAQVWKTGTTTFNGATFLTPHASASVRISYFALGT